MTGHYHLQAVSGTIVGPHSHKDAPYGHEHDGKRGYARTMRQALIVQQLYRKMQAEHKHKPGGYPGHCKPDWWRVA